jgi:hypothetical protein
MRRRGSKPGGSITISAGHTHARPSDTERVRAGTSEITDCPRRVFLASAVSFRDQRHRSYAMRSGSSVGWTHRPMAGNCSSATGCPN